MPKSKSKRPSVVARERADRARAARPTFGALTMSGDGYDHANALVLDAKKDRGRLASARTNPAELVRIASDPAALVPPEEWHQEDRPIIERALAEMPHYSVRRRDDGLFTLAETLSR